MLLQYVSKRNDRYKENYLDLDSIHIQAMPLDDRAREAVKENEAESNDGMLDILAWTHTKRKLTSNFV